MSKLAKGARVRKPHRVRTYTGVTKSSTSTRKMTPASFLTHVMVEGKRLTREEYDALA